MESTQTSTSGKVGYVIKISLVYHAKDGTQNVSADYSDERAVLALRRALDLYGGDLDLALEALRQELVKKVMG